MCPPDFISSMRCRFTLFLVLPMAVLLAPPALGHVLSLDVETGNLTLYARFNFQAPEAPVEIRILDPEGRRIQGLTDRRGVFSFRPGPPGNYTLEAIGESAGGHLHYDKRVLWVPGGVAEVPLWQRLSNSLGYVVGLGGILWGYLVWRRSRETGRGGDGAE